MPEPSRRLLPLLQRPRLVLSFVVLCAVCSAASFALGAAVRSPGDAALQARTPAGPVYTTVTRRVVGELPQVTGAVTGQRLVTVPAPAVPQGQRAVVTAVDVSVGATVRSGSLVARVADRPVLLLRLGVPGFRDLHHGDRGSDVRALQGALRALGHHRGAITGVFDASTEAAVRRLYRAAGVEPRTERVPIEPAGGSRSDTAGTGPGTAGAGADSGRGADSRAGADTPGASPSPTTPTPGSTTPQAPVDVVHVWLPLDEVVVLPAAAAVVTKVAARGTVLKEASSLATLRIGGLRVLARVPVDAAPLFARGRAMTVAPAGVDATTDDVRPARGRAVARSAFRPAQGSAGGAGSVDPGTGGGAPADLPGYDVTVELTGPVPRWLRQGAAVVMRPAAAAGRPSLAVPLVAVRQGGSGAFVLKDAGGGRVVETPVRVLADAAGWAAVEAADLRVDDRVRVDP